MATIAINDKIQTHDHISLGHNTTLQHSSVSSEAFAVECFPVMVPKLLHSKTNETIPGIPIHLHQTIVNDMSMRLKQT